MEKDLFDISAPYTVSEVGPTGDLLFTIIADETKITMEFPDPVSGNTLDSVGFRLTGLDSVQALAVGTLGLCQSSEETDCVQFLDWDTLPITRPGGHQRRRSSDAPVDAAHELGTRRLAPLFRSD